MVSQGQAFREGEGDAWFKRNKKTLGSKEMIEADVPLQMIKDMRLKPKNVLEVGCADGWRLKELQNRYACYVKGVDVSIKAITTQAALSTLYVLSAADLLDLPEWAQGYDLVIVNFVLHWIDRTELLKSVAGIDYVVKPGGHLLIGDFFPDAWQVVPYKHKRGLFTYKQHYDTFFLDSGLYRHVISNFYKHQGDPAACILLKKNVD